MAKSKNRGNFDKGLNLSDEPVKAGESREEYKERTAKSYAKRRNGTQPEDIPVGAGVILPVKKGEVVPKKEARRQQAMRLPLIARWKARGLKVPEIVQKVKDNGNKAYSKHKYHRDMECLHESWRKNMTYDLTILIQEEINAIEENIKELYQEWDKKKEVKCMTEIRNQQVEKRRLLNLYKADNLSKSPKQATYNVQLIEKLQQMTWKDDKDE